MTTLTHFTDRQDAGKRLAQALMEYANKETVVYAVPRGGVPLGTEIAQALHAPLDLIITGKVGHPYNPEYGVCAVSENGYELCDKPAMGSVDPVWLRSEIEKEKIEVDRRRKLYCEDIPRFSAFNKCAIVVDDGVTPALMMRAALQSLRAERPEQLIVAIPVAPHQFVDMLRREADRAVVLKDAWMYLGSPGAYYDDFAQVSDEEVIAFLKQSRSSA